MHAFEERELEDHKVICSFLATGGYRKVASFLLEVVMYKITMLTLFFFGIIVVLYAWRRVDVALDELTWEPIHLPQDVACTPAAYFADRDRTKKFVYAPIRVKE